jgi:hypothetical protein
VLLVSAAERALQFTHFPPPPLFCLYYFHNAQEHLLRAPPHYIAWEAPSFPGAMSLHFQCAKDRFAVLFVVYNGSQWQKKRKERRKKHKHYR